ncbi:tyrosine-type recombinase/integrase [Parvibaculum sp.]|uniref:tyrosine-type recombinase/integrase n=1 Tax=Parvibaculum sp. TaxID=2024848 RepID=UPI003210AAA1
MRALKVRYLESRLCAGGRTAYYYNPKSDLRAAGIVERQPLGDDLGRAVAKAEELNRIVDEWRAATRRGEELKHDRKKPGSIADLFDRYQRSAYFTDRAEKTQGDYRKCMRALEDTVLKNGARFGDMPAAKLEHRHVDSLYELLRKKHGLAYANAMIRVARRAFGLGIRWKLVKQNPFSKPSLKELPARQVVWTAAEMQAFIDSANAAGKPSIGLLMRLAYELAQRLVDVRALSWDIYADGLFVFEQTKTGTRMQLPASDALVIELEGLVRAPGKPLAPCETTGRAWGASHLTHAARDIMRAAGLPDSLRLSDMRRTSLTHLGAAGASDDEMMSMSGHLTRSMLTRYSRATAEKARNALKKRDAWRAENAKKSK